MVTTKSQQSHYSVVNLEKRAIWKVQQYLALKTILVMFLANIVRENTVQMSVYTTGMLSWYKRMYVESADCVK